MMLLSILVHRVMYWIFDNDCADEIDRRRRARAARERNWELIYQLRLKHSKNWTPPRPSRLPRQHKHHRSRPDESKARRAAVRGLLT